MQPRGKIKRKFVGLVAAVSVLAFVGAGCSLIQNPTSEEPVNPEDVVDLTYWSVFNNSEYMDQIIAAFVAQNPNVTIEYKKLEITEYEDELLDALASNRGPDIFSYHTSWLPRYQNKLEPVPANQAPLGDFVPVVTEAAVVDDQLYGLPYTVDTLAMFYNPRLLSSAGVAAPPTTWDEFDDAMEKLAIQDDGEFTRLGAGIGAVDNVNRGVDSLLLLMLQNGTEMVNKEQTEATFANTLIQDNNTRYSPGLAAFNKYLSYSRPTSTTYTWNNNLDTAFNEFAAGRLGILFNYAFNMERITELNPSIEVRTATAPQLNPNSPVSYPSFFLEGVSKKSEVKEQAAAWNFLVFATGFDGAKIYTDATQKPSARFDILEQQQNDRMLAPFVLQATSAKTWYQEDSQAIEAVMKDMVNSILTGERTPENALQLGETQVTNIMQQ